MKIIPFNSKLFCICNLLLNGINSYTNRYRNLTDLENDDIDGVWESNIVESLHDFASQPFEKVCLEYLYLLNLEKKLPFRIHNASRYWGKTVQTIDGKKQSVNLEIDILAPDAKKKSFIFGECKFRVPE